MPYVDVEFSSSARQPQPGQRDGANVPTRQERALPAARRED
jgi:hypothetical protein